MARAMSKLTARTVAGLKEPGRYADGGGLYLQIGPTGSKSWLFMYKRDGKRREMGLGALGDVPLAEARQKAEDARRILAEGGEPLQARTAAQAARKEADAAPTFGDFADQMVEKWSREFSNPKHAAQWAMTLGPTYCAKLRDKKLVDITPADVLAVLDPVWQDKNETASRLRGRIERVLDAAKVAGLRSGENPAQWKGNLEHSLGKRHKLQRGHHAALPYAEVPAFIAALRLREAMAARALEFCILTVARTSEALGATWGEIDLERRVWTIPGPRMKKRREHRVALSEQALAVLREVEGLRPADDDGSAYVFPGQRPRRPLSGMAMEMLLRRQKLDVTVHGFRSAYRDWALEVTDFSREIIEMNMSHVVGDATELAYRRGDALIKRGEIMAAWGAFCLSPTEAEHEEA